MFHKLRWALLGATVIASAWTGQAQAGLTLTAAGIADGFTLTNFAITDPGNTGFGPFGLAAANGTVLVSDYNTGRRYLFTDTDGQTVGSALHTYSSNSSTQAYASTGGKLYGTQDGRFVQFAADGSVDHTLTGVSAGPYLGMVGTPAGHIIATSNVGLINIDPAGNAGTGSYTMINAGLFPDGISLSPDGTTVIAENGGVIQTYDAVTGVLISTYGTSGNPDGTGVIGGGTFNGFIVANTNNGKIDLIDPTLGTYVTIADGGTRGDYTAPDPNGTLLLDYSEGVYRLSIAGGSIGGGSVPEPASLLLLSAGVSLVRRKR